jgi:hypothetical protein
MELKNTECPATVFRFSGRAQFFAAWIAGLSIWVFFALLAVSRHQLDQMVFFVVWSGFWFFLVGGMYRAIVTSDVLVNDTGVSRIIFGFVIQRIQWDELLLIREYSGYVSQSEATLRFLRLVPRRYPFPTFRLCEPMLISDRVDNFEDLIAALNKYVAIYQPSVELKVNGGWQSAKRLVNSP